jgi:predicted TIM-barrel fold metal-dependent hydrolase
MIIDSHLHVWEADSPEYPWRPLAHVRPDYAWPVERLIDVLDQHNIFGGVLVQVSLYRFDNRYLVDCGKRYPDRFRLVGMLDPESAHIESEMEALAEQGVRGLRLAMHLREDMAWYNAAGADRLWKKAGELDMILTLLVGLNHLEDVSKAIQRFPEVRVVIDHLARPDDFDDPEKYPYEKFLQLAQYDQVYIKASALNYMSRQPYPHQDALEWTRQAYSAYGASRMMWGTDTPMSLNPQQIPAMIQLIDLALPDILDGERQDILGGTAWRLFGWPDEKNKSDTD